MHTPKESVVNAVKKSMNKNTKTLKLASGIYECVLGIPFLGGFIIIEMAYVPLIVSLALGIIGLILSSKHKEQQAGHIVQIIAGAIGWIPIVGWGLHVAAAIMLLMNAFKR